MDSEDFTIEFMYKGWDYTGRVTNAETKGNSIFIVRYALDISPQFEKLVEINAVVCEGNNPLEWEEVLDDIRLKKTDKVLIRAIGEALEEREL